MSVTEECPALMIEISFLTAEIIYTAIWLLLRTVVWVRQGKIHWKREAVLMLMYINLAVIIRFVFFPKALYGSVRDIVWNVAGNTAMFIPSGIVLPAVYKKLNSFGKTAAAGALISLCIEILQLPFASRVSDIDDLIQNTLGVAAGYGIFAAVKRLQNVILSRSAVEDRQ